ncbi:MAG TPA: hypothetical protein VN999_18355 [Thermoanaerobaculia bacterium]|nr:hypothetical protein [Thermoanaerobaculia bacterium]
MKTRTASSESSDRRQPKPRTPEPRTAGAVVLKCAVASAALAALAALAAFAAMAPATAPAPRAAPVPASAKAPASPLVDRIGPTGFVEVRAPSLQALPLRLKLLAFHLTQAAVQLDPVFYDQMSSYGLAAKRLLGALVEDPDRLPPASRPKIVEFAKLFFANHGNHDETTSRKFLPGFTAASCAA